mmetsp:Transcript_34143/g.98314  ORF Transcript_34143/g.98314 Transcript_34143/m.98314 type:complete len:257 (+) Transcript_34143:175-945(+)
MQTQRMRSSDGRPGVPYCAQHGRPSTPSPRAPPCPGSPRSRERPRHPQQCRQAGPATCHGSQSSRSERTAGERCARSRAWRCSAADGPASTSAAASPPVCLSPSWLASLLLLGWQRPVSSGSSCPAVAGWRPQPPSRRVQPSRLAPSRRSTSRAATSPRTPGRAPGSPSGQSPGDARPGSRRTPALRWCRCPPCSACTGFPRSARPGQRPLRTGGSRRSRAKSRPTSTQRQMHTSRGPRSSLRNGSACGPRLCEGT